MGIITKTTATNHSNPGPERCTRENRQNAAYPLSYTSGCIELTFLLSLCTAQRNEARISQVFRIQVRRRCCTATGSDRSLRMFPRHKLTNPPLGEPRLVLSTVPCLCTSIMSRYTDLHQMDVQILFTANTKEKRVFLLGFVVTLPPRQAIPHRTPSPEFLAQLLQSSLGRALPQRKCASCPQYSAS